MKKLLSLLSVLTISGTAMPTVIAASFYQKQKSIKNSEINYQQTNNLKNLKRNKREIISANKKIWFGGFDGYAYKGEMKINSDEKKIRFFGNNDKFHKWFSSDIGGVIYYKISIKDHLGNIIKYIEMHSQNSMQDVIRNNNLENGIDYQDGYIVEIYAKEPWRIWFNIGSENSWKRFTDRNTVHPDGAVWDWNWKFRIKNNQIVTYYEYDKKINFLGLGDDYRGEFGLDTTNKKVIFFGNNEWFHSYYDGRNNSSSIYNKIIIKNQNNQIIKEIIINGNQSMQNVINKYNLHNGINYENDYIIDIWSSEPWRVQFSENNNWKYITKNRNLDRSTNNLKQAFKIKNNKLSEYKYQLNNVITSTNLKSINKNNDIVILNELNYLNHNLDISQLEVINKTNTSATIKAKNNSNNYAESLNIYYLIDSNSQNKIINLDELIKKGIFLNFRDKNQGIIIKEITNINKNNLIYSNVTATKSIEPTYTKNSKSICFGTTTLFHTLPEKQKMKTPSCKYTKETTINTQITTGLSKTNSQEKTTEQTSTSNMEHNWSFELGVNVHGEVGIWPFKVSTDINTKIGTGGSYGSSTTNTSSETKTLSNTFDFSDSKTNEYKESSEVELPSQEIEVKPNQKIKIIASLDEVLAQVTLNLKQNIYGEINAKIITLNNEEKIITLSIKEIMQKLKQYDILPQEITINNDDSITFNGKASRSLKQGFDGNIEFYEVN